MLTASNFLLWIIVILMAVAIVALSRRLAALEDNAAWQSVADHDRTAMKLDDSDMILAQDSDRKVVSIVAAQR
ncbi:hypothetical protein [Sphingobium algorifonticola]|uniref:Uncharacterized protein n=1 Tax=Sphingobium algorifonticola TaxID=2008318 RepID=A0A437J6D8_9SPHN|nr:hypothetical protein [Sphingobium algorifonticola]RVT40731.1 hypothetical protein ENE74_09605 [Sphingobium algorifonticola]